MSDLDGVDISELFEVPDELKNKIKNTKNKKPISDERRQKLKEQLARGRETARKNREAKLANKSKPEPEKPKTPEPEVELEDINDIEPDTEIDTTATETQSDIEPTKEVKKKENQKKLGGMIARSKKNINDLVEQKVNEKFKLLAEAVESRRKEKKVSIQEPPKITTNAPEVIKPKVIRRGFKKYPWEQ
jgi:hypothetical protein